jgi:hypothetical protein
MLYRKFEDNNEQFEFVLLYPVSPSQFPLASDTSSNMSCLHAFCNLASVFSIDDSPIYIILYQKVADILERYRRQQTFNKQPQGIL